MDDVHEGEPAKKKLKKQPWWFLILGASIPPLISGFFSYRASVVEAKVHAEAGYEQLVHAIEVLQKHDEEAVKERAQLNGHIQAIEAWMRGMRPHTERGTHEVHLDLPVPKNAPDKLHWRPNFPPQVQDPRSAAPPPLKLPQSLDEAAKK